MGQKYLTVLAKVFFFTRKCRPFIRDYCIVHLYTLFAPQPPPPNTKFCISAVFILSWGGGGADYCNVPPVIAGRNWKQCCFGEGLGGGGTKSLFRSNAKVANFYVRCDVSC